MAKIYAIGDIHGCVTALRSLIETLSPTQNDTFIFLGDLIDPGADSAGVLRYIDAMQRYTQVCCVLGNHEELLLMAAGKKDPMAANMWLAHGGKATLRSMGLSADLHGAFAVSSSIIEQILAMELYVEYPQWLHPCQH